eukprot:s1688_g16.t3
MPRLPEKHPEFRFQRCRGRFQRGTDRPSLARPSKGLVRAATVPVTTAERDNFEVPFANELESDEELLAPEEAEAPISPVTAAITRHRASLSSVAVVRSVPLSRPASATEIRQETSQRPALSRAGSKEMDPAEKAAMVDVQLRPLSREESLRRSASAVSFFKASQAINRRSFSNDALCNALAAARQRRQRAALPPEVPPEEPQSEPAPKPRRRSFAEQFGYGVILKTQLPPQPRAQDAPKPRISSGFIGLQAGDTDLLQRLARRRQNPDMPKPGPLSLCCSKGRNLGLSSQCRAQALRREMNESWVTKVVLSIVVLLIVVLIFSENQRKTKEIKLEESCSKTRTKIKGH